MPFISLRSIGVRLVMFFSLIISPFVLQAQILHVATQNATTAGDGSISVNKPTGTLAGHFMIALVACNDEGNGSNQLGDATAAPVGWTEITQAASTTGNNEVRFALFYRIATSADDAVTSYTFDLDDSSDGGRASITTFSGVSVSGGFNAAGAPNTGPFDTDPGTFTLNTTSAITTTGITTVTANSAVLMVAMSGINGSFSGWTTTSPGNLSEIFDGGTGNGSDCTIGIAASIKATAGATGTGSVTASASDISTGLLLALRPCVQPATPTVSFVDNTLCVGEQATLNITGNLNGATQWSVYTGSCGGTLVGSTTTGQFNFNVTTFGTYYVRGTGGCASGGACGTAVLSPTPGVPGCATAPFPTNLATEVAINDILNWEDVPCATNYQVYFGTNNPPTNIINGTLTGGASQYDPAGNLTPNTTYYWRIVPTNSNGAATCPTVWSFTTDNGTPDCVNPVSPIQGELNVAPGATLSWTADPLATGYSIYFGTNNPPTNIANGTALGNVLTYDPPGDMTTGTTYYWRVIPTNAQGSASGCAVNSFTVYPASCNSDINLSFCTTCTTCSWVTQTNPNLVASCNDMKIAFIIDESQSIGGNNVDVEDGVMNFVNALSCRGVELAVVEFNSSARFVLNGYHEVDNSVVTAMQNYFDNVNNALLVNNADYGPSGYTNYQAAMMAVDALSETPDLILFFSDGVPTMYYNTTNPNYSVDGVQCGDTGAPQAGEVGNAAKVSNKLKCEGAHVFFVGVNMTNTEVNNTVQYISENAAAGSVITDGYALGNFEALAGLLGEAVSELCELGSDVVTSDVCPGSNQGSMLIEVPAALIPFDYTVTDANDNVVGSGTGITEDNFIVGNLNPGTYTIEVTVTVSSTCTRTETFFETITAAQLLQASVGNITHATCANANAGTATFSSTQGEAPYVLTVTGPVNFGPQVINTFPYILTGLSAGNYAATVSDVNDCNDVLLNFTINPATNCCVPVCPPANVTISCLDSTLPSNPAIGMPTMTEGCGTVSYSDNINGMCPTVITRTWTSSVTGGTICTQTITIVDNNLPVITCPSNITLSVCNEAVPAPNVANVTASDGCSTPVVTFVSDVVNTVGCIQTTTRTYRATDACGNSATCSHTITRTVDTTNPSITCPANVQLACNAVVPAPNVANVTVSDGCSTPVVTFVDDVVNTVGCVETTTRTYRATDACGNSATCSHTYTRTVDTTNPSITCPANVQLACNAVVPAPNVANVTVSDGCSTPVVTFVDDVVNTVGCVETTTRTYRATDACGNSATCSHTYTRTVDTTNPSITCPANVQLACNAVVPAPNVANVTVSDGCSTPVVTFVDDVVNTVGCIETTTRTYRATDACGNSATCSHTYTRTVDTTNPSITCPANVQLACNAVVPAPNVANVTVSDGCSTPVVTFVDDVVNTVGCIETTTRTYRATDACGNSATCSHTYTRTVDTTNPSITCPANVQLACNAVVPAPNVANVTVSDGCSTPVVTFVDDVVNTVGCVETTTRTYRATDACGNSATCSHTYTRTVDTTNPSITCPANVQLACNAVVPAPNVANVTVSDGCSTPVVTFVDDVVNTVGCIETTTRTYRATDACGNSATCSHTYTRTVDTTNPSITCPANVQLACNAVVPVPNVANVTVSDGCSTPVVTFVDDVVNTVGCVETTTRTYRATDACGNSATCSHTYTRTVDTTNPSITCPANVQLACNAVVPAPNVANVTVSDGCSTPVVTFVNDEVNTVGCIETTIRTYRATDACGNSATCSHTYTRTVDTTNPSITCPANVPLECNAEVPAPNVANVTVSDGCSTPTVTFVDDVVSTVGCVETTTRTYRATDACGNSATCSHTYTRTVDTTNPSITCPANVQLACNAVVPAPNVASVTVSDGCSTPVVTFVDDVVSTVGCVETTTRTYRATDACGNSATCSHTYTRTVDTTNPSITCPANVTLECNAAVPAPNVANVTVSDGCSTPVVTFVNDDVNTIGCVETTTRTYRATDACGNSATCSHTYTRTVDTTNPSITCPANVQLACNAVVPAPNVANVTVSDGCSTPVVTFVNDDVNTVGCVETTTRTYRATDACGNSATCSHTYTRTVDTTNPSITCPANVQLACNAVVPAPNVANVTVSDGCSTPVVTFVDDVVNTVGCVETTTRTYRATDACGNSATCSHTYTRTVDTTNPSITCPANVQLACNAVVPAPNVANVTVSDACSTPEVTFVNDVVDTVGCIETTIRTYRATDACGNSATCSHTYTRTVDTTNPSITCPANVQLACNAVVPAPNVANVTVSDGCSTPVVTFVNDDVNTVGCVETTTRTYRATDACGNSATCSHTYTRTVDTTNPTITCPANVQLACNAVVPAPNVANVTVSDGCSTPVVTFVNDEVSTVGCVETTTRTYRATDACGNSATCSHTYTRTVDTTNPSITCPANVTLECNAAVPAPNVANVTVSDACSTPEVTFVNDVVDTVGCIETTIRTYRATDGCGNSATCSHTITRPVDLENPVITCPPSPQVRNPNPGLETYTVVGTEFDPTVASDNCGSVTVTNSLNNLSTLAGYVFSVGSTSVTWYAQDACGNLDSCSVIIIIDDAPIADPDMHMMETNDPPQEIGVLINDDFGGDGPCVNCQITIVDPPSNGTGSVDDNGTPEDPTDDVIIYEPNEDYTGLDTLIYEICDFDGDCDTAIVLLVVKSITVDAMPDCEMDVPYLIYNVTPNFFTPVGGLTMTWLDENDNVIYTESGLPLSGTVLWPGAVTDMFGNGLDWPGWIYDNVNNTWYQGNDGFEGLTPTAKVVFSVNPVDTITVNYPPAEPFCHAIPPRILTNPDTLDGCINTPLSINVLLNDQSFGTLLDASTLVIDQLPLHGTATVTADSVITYVPDEDFQGFDTLVYVICDTNAMAPVCSKNFVYISIFDTVAPVLICLPVIPTISCPTAPFFPTPDVSDDCDMDVMLTFEEDTLAGDCIYEYAITRTWTATDEAGNTSTCSATIVVVDNTAPVCTTQNIVIDTFVDPELGMIFLTPEMIDAGSFDLCSDVTLDIFPDMLTCEDEGVNVITLTVTDVCGNTSTCTATVTLDCVDPCVEVNVHVYLEGSAIDPSGGNTFNIPMRTTLNNLKVLPGQTYQDLFSGTNYTPAGQPYTGAPWNYSGTEGDGFDSNGNPGMGSAGYPSTVVDWVLVSLREDTTSAPVCMAAALLHNDGHVEFVEEFDCCDLDFDEPYFVVVEHRNHLIVMSEEKIPIDANTSVITYDFRSQESFVFDPFEFGIYSGQKEIQSGVFAMLAGNSGQVLSANDDTDLNFIDRSTWEQGNSIFGQYRIEDHNMNGDTNFNDRTTWEKNNGKFTSVPRD